MKFQMPIPCWIACSPGSMTTTKMHRTKDWRWDRQENLEVLTQTNRCPVKRGAFHIGILSGEWVFISEKFCEKMPSIVFAIKTSRSQEQTTMSLRILSTRAPTSTTITCGCKMFPFCLTLRCRLSLTMWHVIIAWKIPMILEAPAAFKKGTVADALTNLQRPTWSKI